MAGQRMSSQDRREQIVAATLELLGSHPLADVSTRRIARRVGVSQPALFRHFRSRDALILAAIDEIRDQLGAMAAQVLERGDPPLVSIEALIQALLDTAKRHPGLPRLLFQDVGSASASAFRAPLSHLVEMQAALLATLTAKACDAGELPADLDAVRAGRLLQAWVQGLLLQGLLGGPVQSSAQEMVAVWAAGLRQAGPRGGLAASPRAHTGTGDLVGLDLRPILGSGVDPLAHVLAALDGLAADGLLVLTVPFRPAPLLALLRGKGMAVQDHDVGGTWEVLVRGPDAPEPLDLRQLPAPEPLQGVLEAASALDPGQALLARTPRLPQLLLGHLDERGLTHHSLTALDGSGLLFVRRAAP